MSAKVLDGRVLAAKIRLEVAAGVAELVAKGGRKPGLAVILAGEDPASQVYVGSKVKACAEVGMVGKKITLPATLSAAELHAAIEQLNQDSEIDGFLVQLPLPNGLSERDALIAIDPDKDVDGFHPTNVGRLWVDEPGFTPATPTGIIRMLREHYAEVGGSLSGKEVVIVGRSAIVGKPMAGLLLREHCTVTIAHSRTKDLAAVCRRADIVIAAVGRPGLIGPDHIREGAVVVDVGINRVSDADTVARMFPGDAKKAAQLAEKGSILTGDVDYVAVLEKAGAVSPVPGGVGPLTVAMLVASTLASARRRQGF
ncbi:MAG: bifunctional 5,10-methylenetetrahydrofolate dehydrogenase/5,10-methenyltetrahydrofolate cyclohydrolase [Acidobacteriota bacterium]